MLLKYDEATRLFFFEAPPGAVQKVHNIRRINTNSGLLWAFTSGYPDGYISIKDFKTLFPEAKATANALTRINYLKDVPAAISERRIINSSGYEFRVPPYEHHLASIEHMAHMPYLALVLAPGLGKTYIALNYLALRKKLGLKVKAIILCPKIVLTNWMRENDKFTDLHIIRYTGNLQQRAKLKDYIPTQDWDVVLTNYDTLVPATYATGAAYLEFWNRLPAAVKNRKEARWVERGWVDKIPSDNDDLVKFLRGLPREETMPALMSEAKKASDDGVFLRKLKANVFIADEAHRLKSHKAKRSVEALELAKQAECRYLLTGTMCLGNPLDVYMPYTILGTQVLGSTYHAFKNFHCTFSQYNKHAITGYRHLDILKTRIDPYTVSISREQCLDLPERTLETSYYDIDGEQLELYNKIADRDTKEVIVGGKVIDLSLTMVKINKLLQVLSGFIILPINRDDSVCATCPRILTCVETDIMPWQKKCVNYGTPKQAAKPEREYYAFGTAKLAMLEEDLDSTEEPMIIWGYFQRDIENIEKLLKDKGISYVLADAPQCDVIFEKEDGPRVFLGQVSQGIGITLNRAGVMVYYGHSIKLEDRLQSIDRNYRIGQEKRVLVKDYAHPEGVDMAVLRLLQDKRDVKDFIQAQVVCAECSEGVSCFTRGIIPFSDKCVHGEARRVAEDRRVIAITPVQGG